MSIRHINTPAQFIRAAIYAAEGFRGMGGRAARFDVRQAVEGARTGRIPYAEAVERIGTTLVKTDPARRLRLSGRLRAGIRQLLAA